MPTDHLTLTTGQTQETTARAVVVPSRHSPRGCSLCGASTRDHAGAVKHEGCCPHFMRGPDAGGDPHEWETLLDHPNVHTKGDPNA